MKTLDDNSKMPFGIHQGKAMANVPSDYLLWLYENGKTYGALKQYIEDNLDAIKQDLKSQENGKG